MSKKDALACQVSLGLFAGLLGIASTAHGAPVHDGGGDNHNGVRAGDVTIGTPSNGEMNITSTSQNNVIGWKDFSIGKDETVTFNDKNYLNIVTGKVTSHIDGTMKGGKNVYIANSHGVVFGDGASVDVGNLYVTTRKLDADAIGTSVKNGTIDLDAPTSAGVTGNIINGSAASSAGLAKSDIVSLVDGSGSVKATKIVLEGKSVRIMNDAKIDSSDVSAVADQSALEVNAGGMKTVRANKGYVHVGYASSAPTYGSTGKYKNLTDANMYKLVGSKADLDAIRTTAGGLAGRYMLRNDIDFGGAAHTSIGTNTDPFTGKFDGMFHEIKNMTVASGSPAEYAGLFGTTNGATIMNVGLKNANLSTVQYGGGLVGHAKGHTVISAVYNESTTSIGAGNDAGGLVGWLDSSSLDNAYNTADVGHGGGLVGRFDGSSKMYAVYNTGAITSGVSSSAYKIYGNNVVTTGSDVAFIKDAYTNRVELTPSVNNGIIYNSYTMDTTGTASLVVPSGTPTTGDGKQAATYEGWDISDEGGANTTWRLFAGHSTPLLTAFMQGTVQAEYSYADFERPNHGHSGNVASDYTVRIDGTLKTNDGKSMPERTYNATYRKMTKADGTEIGGISDVTIHGYPSPAPAAPNNIELNANHGRRNAGKEAMLYSGQHGYDVAGANLHIEKRKVVGAWEDLTIEKEYDTTTDATEALKKSLTADSIRLTGVIDGDDATIGIDPARPVTANFADANAGYGKSLTIGGTFTLTGADAKNYSNIDAASLTPPPTGLKGNIRQKTVTIGFKAGKNFNKTYDGTPDVKDEINPKKPVGTNVLELTGVAGGEDLKLNNSDITAKYMTGKGASDKERSNAGTNVDIAYKNIKLADGTTGKAKNYRLVDDKGNVLYREGLAGEPTDMTKPENSANPRYIGAVKTDGATFWGTGDIKKRKIDAGAFTVEGGVDRAYNGTDYLVVDGKTKKVKGPAAAAGTDTNIVASDAGKISFSISASDKRAYYVQGDRTTRTKNAYDAAHAADGAQYLSYTLKAHNETSEDALSNYELNKGGGEALSEGSIHTVTGEGKITPRTVYVDLLKQTGIDKTYDKSADILAADKQFGTNFGYRKTADSENKLVKDDGAADDGAQITATAAVYKTKSGHAEQDYEVYRAGNALTGAVEDNGKDVEYTIGLAGDHAATNYRLSYTPSGGGATQTGSSVTMKGAGKITPKKLTLASPGNVTRAYDGTSKVYASQLPASYKNVTAGVESGDIVHLDFGTGDPATTQVGTYYDGASEAKDANADKNNALMPGRADYTVKYTFTPTLDNGNYEVDATTPPTGKGRITQLAITNAGFEMDFGEKKKVFDGNKAVRTQGSDDKQLSALKFTSASGKVMDFLNTPGSYKMMGGEYSSEHANYDRNDALISGKTKHDITYQVHFPGENSGNYDFSGFTTAGEYTKTGNQITGYTISRKKPQVGIINQMKVLAQLAPRKIEKDYNGKTDVIDGNGNPIVGDAIVNMNLSGGRNKSFGTYDTKDAGTDKTVTYKLRLVDPLNPDPVNDDYKDDYYFVNAQGDVITELKGKGTINPRKIDVVFKDANKVYDGTPEVDKASPTWGYTFKAHKKDLEAAKTENLAQADHLAFDLNKLTAQYMDAERKQTQSDAGTYERRVRYGNLQEALSSKNYQIVEVGGTTITPVDTKWGSGEIKKRTFATNDIDLAIGRATKVYDGTRVVKKDGRENSEHEYIQRFRMNLGGAVGWKDYALGKDYSFEGAKYDDPNVAANTAPQPGKIQYKFSLKDSPILKNYDFTNLPAGYTLVGDTLTRTIEGNTITKRPVYAHVKDVSKIYNALTDVRGGDGDGHILSSRELATFDNKLNGAAVDDTGLIKEHENLNATQAAYDTKTAGTGKTVNYRLSVDSNAAIAGNYDIYDGKTGALLPTNAAGEYLLATTTNTIEKRAIKLQTQTGVTKEFDNTDVVKVGGTPSATNAGLSIVSGKQGSDNVDLNTTYTRVYRSKMATRTAESKKDNIKYNHIQLTGTDAANYYLADSTGKALDVDTTAGFFKTTGDGEITPLKVTRANFNLKLKDLDKTYDGNAFVKDGTPENPAGWKAGHIDKSEITDGSNNHLYDLKVDKVASATYRNAGNTADDKNAGQNKKVLFKLKFTKDTLNNFDFNALKTADTNGQMIDGVYHAYGTGKITPKDLRVNLDGYARKPYDGTADVKDVEERLSLVKEDIVSGDKVSLGSSKGYYQQGTAAGSPKVANANIAPTAANAKGYDVAYTVQSDGADRNNYRFINAADGMEVNHNGGSIYAKGDIERRKLYASTKPVEKTYNADTDVRIKNALASANDLVEFHDAGGKKDAVFASGSYGTNATTAAYVANPAVPSAAAADASDTANKWVKYTLKIDGKDAGGTDYANNYVVYDKERPNTVLYDAAAGTNDGLTTTTNKINRAPLSVTAKSATKQYDGGRKVKNPSPDTLLNITGGWQGTDGGDLNRTAYTATYLDENVNKKGVDYGNIQIVPTGTTKASNYVLSYNGKDVERSGEVYHLHGEGEITKRILTGNDLTPGFTTTPIEKTYDGTADVKNPSQYVRYMRTRYTKDDGTPLDLAADGYKVERADYLDKADGTKAKDVATGKDVKFQFALSDGNFDYSHLTGVTPGADGVYHFSQDYGRDAAGVGRGTIKGRLVGVTLHLVQKLYDGTTGVKNGYYTRDANGNLIEHKNSDVDWKQVFTLNGTHGEIAGDANSGFANGETFDFDASGSYGDAQVNRGPQYTNNAKDVAYRMKLKQDSANRNYTFQYRVVDADGRELAATKTAQTVFDANGNPTGHDFSGKGDIWQKRLTLHAEGIDRDYNGKAELTPEQRRALTFDGVAQTDSAAFNFSNPNDARAAGFVDRIRGRYGDRSADAFTANAHVKRPAANINGKPEARDVEFTGVKRAFESLLKSGDVANNYFYDGDNTVYGTGTIRPVKRTLQKTWQKGAAFEKMYDGDARAMIGGKHAWESAEAKQAFHDKLRLSVDLGTGEKPIELDYSLYGDAAGDIGEPHYENFSGRTAHHGQDDANVRNSADPNDTLEKDIVYRLKSVDGDKAWRENPDAPKYKDWELAEEPSGKEVRLSDTDADNSAGLKAYIKPRAITLKADEYSKIYDGTAGVAAPSLSADALAEKERELRSKLHVTDDETKALLGRDGVDFTVDAVQSQFLRKGTYHPDADVARDAAGNVPKDGKLVEYKLSKTGGVIEQGNYVLPTGTQTDAFLGAGSITPRIVRVRFNPTDTATPDKIYDGTQYTVKDGKLFSRTFELVPQGVDEGIVETDRDGVRLNKTANIGRFASPNVQKENGGVQDVFYNDGLALTNDTGKAGNYTLESGNLRDTARITPRPLDIYLKDGDIRKEYDGTTNVADKFQTANNIAILDRNRDVEGIAKPALPTWNAGDAATYDSKNAGGRTVFYNPSWTDGNFVLQKGQKTVNPTNPNDPTIGLAEIRRLEYTAVDSDGRPQMKDGVYGTRIEADGVIDRRKIKIEAARDADKIYDGKANVLNPLGNLSFNYNGENAERNEANGLVEGEGDAVKAALRVQGVYRSNDDSAADANAADSDAQDYKKHPVRYTFEKDEARDPVLANYEIATDMGENTVKGAGVIRRRTLNVLPDPQATYARKSNVNYTGHIEDGSKEANEGSPLTPEVAADVERFNSGVFFYGPKTGTSYNVPGQSDIQGWYRKDGVSGDILASGNYGSNYTLQLKPSKLSVAPRVDKVVPERTVRPDSKVYGRAAFDESNAFGKSRDLDAALAYTGKGVNTGGTKPQGANAGDAGIGTGTNIGSSASAGGAAGASGKVQGTTSAQPGAAVKPQGTTGGNAALAGGTAGSVGYYRSGAQPGASVKPQGAQQGAAVKPQGAASAAGSLSRTGGAGSVVDRGLAAAAGMSDGSSSGAGVSGRSQSTGYSSGTRSYVDGSSRAADRGLANAVGRGSGGAGYYSGKGYSHTDDDEEEEIKKKTKASA